MAKILVRDLMTEKVYSIRPDEDLARLSDLMGDIHVRHVPVVDEGGEILGIVSHRDLVRGLLSAGEELPVTEERQLMKSVAVGEIMTTGVETTEPGEDIRNAGRTMLDNKLGCLPVVENGRLVGILTEADFVKYIVNEMAE